MARDTGHRLRDPRDADDSKVYGSQLVQEGQVADACIKLGGVVLRPGKPRAGFDREQRPPKPSFRAGG